MKIIVFGTGRFYQQYKKWLAKTTILAFLDNDPSKQKQIFDGVLVDNPIHVKKYSYDKICILSIYRDEMYEQLLSLGVAANDIYDQHDLLHFGVEPQFKIYGTVPTYYSSKNLLLISHELSLIGAPIALSYAADILCDNGFNVVIAANSDGLLREKYEGKNIPVIIDERLDFCTLKELSWLSVYAKILVNSLDWYKLLTERDENIPVLWWIHEEKSYYTKAIRQILTQMVYKNLQVVAVSRKSQETFQKYSGISVGRLLYGIPDEFFRIRKSEEHSTKRKITFAVIGSFIPRKGQDIFIKAISLINNECRAKANFIMIGAGGGLFARKIMTFADNENICIFDEQPHDVLVNMYQDIDVIVCPSIEDPMPIVIAEAMMMKRLCIVSNTIGFADLLSNENDKIVFESRDAEQLARLIEWHIEHFGERFSIVNRMREIYETYFSMTAFEQNMLPYFESKDT